MMHGTTNIKKKKVYLSFLHGSQNTEEFFPLYNTKWLVFITGTDCDYCAVRTQYLNVIQVNFMFVRGSPEYFVTASNDTNCTAGHTSRR